jgi:hypothetical protein
MKIYLGYKAFPFMGGWQAVKAFKTEEQAKEWSSEENSKVFQEFDDCGLIEGEEFNYMELELE